MADRARLPVTLVTGFLGSGKTTLINRALRDPRLANALVVVNEFGEVGLDHVLIEHSRDAVLLLDNGCLCCAVRGDLVAALGRLYERRATGGGGWFDRVVVETSGLAEPAVLADMLDVEPGLAARYARAGCVVTVDAVNAATTLAAHDVALRQIALADRLVVTKADLLPERERAPALAGLMSHLRSINPRAELRLTDDGEVAALFVDVAPGGDGVPDEARAGTTREHAHERVRQYCLVREEPLDERTLALFLESLERAAGPNLLRVKGLVNVAGRPAALHGAQRLVHRVAWLDRWPDEDRRSRLVFLTLDVADDDVAALLASAECLVRKTRAAGRRSAGAAAAEP